MSITALPLDVWSVILHHVPNFLHTLNVLRHANVISPSRFLDTFWALHRLRPHFQCEDPFPDVKLIASTRQTLLEMGVPVALATDAAGRATGNLNVALQLLRLF